jgi:hypothetical protein
MTEIGGALGGPVEEFKFQDDEDEQIDLLNDRGLSDLKNALQMGNFSQFDNDDLYKIKNNTIIGTDRDEEAERQEILRSML